MLFTLDETVFSRELAPLAGFYPSVYVGAPWWFLDAPEAMRRFRAAVTETAGFSRTSGFIDDTRAFCSIPARHDMSRRLDAGVPRRGSSPSTGSTRTRRWRRRSTWSAAGRARCSSCDRGCAAAARPAGRAPVRLVHLGLGSFFRAHQAWYTDRAPDAADWGIAAFTGRGATSPTRSAAQDGLYTLVTRGRRRRPLRGRRQRRGRARRRRPRRAGWRCLASPDVARGDPHRHRGRLPAATPPAASTATAPGGRRHRRAARATCARPVRTSLPGCSPGSRPGAAPTPARSRWCRATTCPANGRCCSASSPTSSTWSTRAWRRGSTSSVSFVTTVVDRITPAPADADAAAVERRPGWHDRAPVVTEPFSEWVIERRLPRWSPGLGATPAPSSPTTSTPFEQRKLWLLNGGHSLLAYARLGPRPRHRRRGGRRRHCRALAASVVGGGRARTCRCRPPRSRPTRRRC